MSDPDHPPALLCILNPASRNGEVVRQWPLFAGICNEAGLTPELVEFSAGDLAGEVLRLLRGRDYLAILGLGGDGTHRSVINALMTIRRDHADVSLPPYLPVPFGTGNDVAKSLGLGVLRRDPGKVPALVREGGTVKLDLGRLAHGYFADAISVGLDARVLDRRDRLTASLPPLLRTAVHGYLPYALAGLASALSYRPGQCDIRLDGEHFYCGPFANLLLNNTRVYGGVFDPTPEARHDDGRLDLLLLANRPACLAQALFSCRCQPTFLRRLPARLAPASIRTASFTRCQIALEPPAPLQLDGEYLGVTHELCVDVEPAAIAVSVPLQP